MDYRDELDRAAHVHGYEEREDEPDCSECIHQPMCSGKNCHFDQKWYPEDLEKKYYHISDGEWRISDELYSKRDIAEQFTDWPSDLEGPFFIEKRKWERENPKKPYRVRVEIVVDVEARDNIDAEQTAIRKCGVNADDPSVEAFILRQYRMPVQYFCCEEGRTYGYEYNYANSAEEAKFKFQQHWIPDIESSPCFDDIEEYNEWEEEWTKAYMRRID